MEKFSMDSAPHYSQHYDESGFWRKVKHVAAQVGAKVLYPALQLHKYLTPDINARAIMQALED